MTVEELTPLLEPITDSLSLLWQIQAVSLLFLGAIFGGILIHFLLSRFK